MLTLDTSSETPFSMDDLIEKHNELINSPLFTTHIESFVDNLPSLKFLFETHYREVSQHKRHSIALNPDYDKYRMKEAMGELLFIALRQNGRLVGYFNGFIGSALHYRDCLQLSLDLLYVLPGSRGQINGHHGGTMLLHMAKAEATRRGVKLFTMGYKSARAKHMKKLLEDNGFEPFEVHYGLWL